jgi:hypothetical protein
VLPLNWVPAVVWIASPVFFAASIIVSNNLARSTRKNYAPNRWRKACINCFSILAGLFGVSVFATLLIILSMGSKEPIFMRGGWTCIDITQPAVFSLAVQRSDSTVNIPSDVSLTLPEHEVAEELSRLTTAKNKLWVMTRIKIEHCTSAQEFAQVLNNSADGFKMLWERMASIYERYQINDPESLDKINELTKQMGAQSNEKTKVETQKYIAVYALAFQKFGEDEGVQQAMLKLGRVNTI